MSTVPEERYVSVSALKKDIESFLNGYATKAEEASSLKLLKLFVLRNKALSFICTVSLLVIIFGTLTFIKNIQEEKKIAQENLRLFKEQKEETYKAQKEYYQALITEQNNSFHTKFDVKASETHKKTINGLKELIEAYPQYTEAKSALGYHLFIGQEFHQSENYLSKNPGIYSYMLPHIQKYKNIKKDQEFLPADDFLQLLKEIEPLKVLHLKMLMIYTEKTKDKKAIIPIIKYILMRLNPDWDPNNFDYNPVTERLTITGKNFKRLNISYGIMSPILALRIKALNLRGTGIESLLALKDASIRALDISDTKVPFNHLHLHQSKALLRLVIKSNQYKKWQLKQLPGVMEIKFSDIPNN